MPLEIPTVLLALEQPIPLREIRLSGTGLKSARVWLSTYDPVEFYDTEDWQDLGQKQGSELTWAIAAALSTREASVILVHAEVSANDRRLGLSLQKTRDGLPTTEGTP